MASGSRSLPQRSFGGRQLPESHPLLRPPLGPSGSLPRTLLRNRPQRTVELCVRNLAGEALKLAVPVPATVAGAKAGIAAQWRLPAGCQNLLRGGDSLGDDEELKAGEELTLLVSLEGLRRDLASRRISARVAAARTLKELRGSEEVAAVAGSALEDAMPEVRQAAVDALLAMGGEQSMQVLKERLTHVAAFVRKTVAEAFASVPCKDEEVLQALLDVVLADASAAVRAAAAEALNAAGPCGTAVVRRLTANLDHADPAVRCLVISALSTAAQPGDAQAIVALSGRLRDNRDSVRRAAAGALGTVAGKGCKSAAESLKRALGEEPAPGVRQVITEALACVAEQGDDEALAALAAVLEDANYSLRSLGSGEVPVLRFAEKGDARAVGLVRTFLERPEEEVRALAAESLCTLSSKGDGDVVTSFLALLEDESLYVRRAAVKGLSVVSDGEQGTIEALLTLLGHPEWEVRCAALQALSVVAKPGEEAVLQALFACLRDGNAEIRQAAAQALPSAALEGDSHAISELVTLLEDPSDPVRSAAVDAIMALVARGDETAISAIARLLKSPDASIRCDATRALGAVADTAALEQLIPMLRDPAKHVRCAAAEGLGELAKRLQPGQLQALEVCLRDPEDCVRRAVADAAASLAATDSAAVALLMELRDDLDDYVRCVARSSLREGR